MASEYSATPLIKRLRRVRHVTDSHFFEIVFREALNLLLDALSAEERNRITVSTTQFQDLTFNYYVKPTGEVNKTGRSRNAAENTQKVGLLDRIASLLESLRYNDDSKLSPDLGVDPVIVHFLEQYYHIYITSWSEVHEFFVRCLTYEWSLKNRSIDDTNQLLEGLDGLLEDPLATDRFEKPLRFESNSTVVNRAYRTFVDSLLLNPAAETSEEIDSVAMRLTSEIELQLLADCLEIERFQGKEEQVSLIYELFLGSEHEEGIVPRQFLSRAETLLDSIVPYDRRMLPSPIPASDLSGPTQVTETQIARTFNKDELVQLVTDVKTVVGLLNEYDPQFHPQFSYILRHFLNLVFEDYSDMASEGDYRYISKLSDLVVRMSNFDAKEEDDINGEVIGSIIEEFHYYQGFLTSTYKDSTILMRLASKEYFLSLDLIKRALQIWNDRLVSIIRLESNLQHRLSENNSASLQRHLTCWYNKFIKVQKLSSQAGVYSSKRLLAKVLKDHWILKVIKLCELEGRSRKFVLQARFGAWKSEFKRVAEMQSRSNEFYNRGILSATFAALKKKSETAQANHKKAEEVRQDLEARRDAIIRRDIVRRWHLKLDHKDSIGDHPNEEQALSKKLAQLNLVAEGYLRTKSFALWRKKFVLCSISKQSSASGNRNLKRILFKTWKKKYDLQVALSTALKKRERALKASAFTFWSSHKFEAEKAYQFQRKNLLKSHFRKWILARRANALFLDQSLKLTYFKRWNLNSLSLELRVRLKEKVLRVAFATWTSRWRQRSVDERRAVSVFNKNVIRGAFDTWLSRASLTEELSTVAKLNTARRYFDIWHRRMSSQREMEARSIGFRDTISVKNKVLIKTMLKVWQAKLVARFQSYSTEAIKSFDETVRQQGTLAVFLRHWKKRVTEQQLKQAELDLRLQEYDIVNPLLGQVVRHWSNKLLDLTELQTRSDNFHRDMLHKKFLVIWYEKLVLKVNYLDELAEELLNQKAYSTTVDYLRKWNLKYVKTYKRNLQTCQMFEDKWNMSRARNLLQVWHHKAFLEKGDRNVDENDDYGEANTSIFYSSLSPLAKKRGNFFEGHSYLHTPIKKQVSTPFTPSSRIRRTSPTKLQDANQKMNSDKIDALINHYRKAHNPRVQSSTHRKQVSPLRLQGARHVRLSPPRPSHDDGNVYRLPAKPPAPQFENILTRESSPQATSSPFEPRNYQKLPSPLPSAEIDASVLSTAKKLRRFRPLIIPKSEGRDDAQASPVVQLRERLANASRLVNSRNTSQAMTTDS